MIFILKTIKKINIPGQINQTRTSTGCWSLWQLVTSSFHRSQRTSVCLLDYLLAVSYNKHMHTPSDTSNLTRRARVVLIWVEQSSAAVIKKKKKPTKARVAYKKTLNALKTTQ